MIEDKTKKIQTPITEIFESFVEGDFIWLKDVLYLFTYFTGKEILPVFCKFDLSNNAKEELSVPSPRFMKKALAVGLLNENPIICMSGGENEEGATDTWYAFYPNINEMIEGARLNIARSHHCCVQFSNTYLYVFGGYYYPRVKKEPWSMIESISVQNLVESSQKWNEVKLASGDEITWIQSAAIDFGRRILIFGGKKLDSDYNTRKGYAFDPSKREVSKYFEDGKEVMLEHSWRIITPPIKVRVKQWDDKGIKR